MTIGETILQTIYNAMLHPAFVDSPLAPWREPVLRCCIERTCAVHKSCLRREAFAEFEAWWVLDMRRGWGAR